MSAVNEALQRAAEAVRDLAVRNRDLMERQSKAENHLKLIRMNSTEEHIKAQATKALLEITPNVYDEPSDKGIFCEGGE